MLKTHLRLAKSRGTGLLAMALFASSRALRDMSSWSSTRSDVFFTDKTNEIFVIVSCLTRDAWKASRHGDPRSQVNRPGIQGPRSVGGHRMKIGMAKAYRVAPPAIEYLKVEKNMIDSKEYTPESEAGRRHKRLGSKPRLRKAPPCRSHHRPTLDGIRRSRWPRPNIKPNLFSGRSSYIWS